MPTIAIQTRLDGEWNRLSCVNNMKSKNYHTAETILKSNRQIVDQGKIDTLSTQLHDCSLSCLGTGTSIRRV
jgi:hypothetical protein